MYLLLIHFAHCYWLLLFYENKKPLRKFTGVFFEVPSGFEPLYEVLQTSA